MPSPGGLVPLHRPDTLSVPRLPPKLERGSRRRDNGYPALKPHIWADTMWGSKNLLVTLAPLQGAPTMLCYRRYSVFDLPSYRAPESGSRSVCGSSSGTCHLIAARTYMFVLPWFTSQQFLVKPNCCSSQLGPHNLDPDALPEMRFESVHPTTGPTNDPSRVLWLLPSGESVPE